VLVSRRFVHVFYWLKEKNSKYCVEVLILFAAPHSWLGLGRAICGKV